MSIPSIPLVNGIRYSFASIEIMLPSIGKRYVGFNSINYEDLLDPGKAWGTSQMKIGRTAGKHDPSADMEMFLQEADDFMQALSATGGDNALLKGAGVGLIPFGISVAYSEVGSPTITDVIEGARITNISKKRGQGTDALVTSFKLDVMRIKHNGLYIFSAPNLAGTN
jgi:hypothetical protein